MMITVHLSDGRKITKDEEHLLFFRDGIRLPEAGDVEPGYILINLAQVVDIRPAEEDEIEHAKIHGW